MKNLLKKTGSKRIAQFISAVAALFFIAWPLGAFYAIKEGLLALFLIATLALLVLRSVALYLKGGNSALKEIFATVLPCCALIAAAIFFEADWALFYPVVVNLSLLILFAYSLSDKPIIQKFAEIMQKGPLPPEGIAYTRKVTILWIAFFTANGSIACATVFLRDLEVWALYNGFISYLAIGLLFIGELFYRKAVLRV